MEHSLQYSFTDDKKKLRQYQRLRKLIYDTDLGLSLDHLEDPFDAISHTLVVQAHQRCVGGVRLTLSTPEAQQFLPMESDGFYLQDVMPTLPLNHVNYAELSKLILLPGYRNGKVTERIYKHIHRKCRMLNIKYLFAITPRIQARRYLLSSKKLGFNIRIANNPIPTDVNNKYGGLAECLVILEQVKRKTPSCAEEEAVVNY